MNRPTPGWIAAAETAYYRDVFETAGRQIAPFGAIASAEALDMFTARWLRRMS